MSFYVFLRGKVGEVRLNCAPRRCFRTILGLILILRNEMLKLELACTIQRFAPCRQPGRVFQAFHWLAENPACFPVYMEGVCNACCTLRGRDVPDFFLRHEKAAGGDAAANTFGRKVRMETHRNWWACNVICYIIFSGSSVV